jgi:hypothetical protein
MSTARAGEAGNGDGGDDENKVRQPAKPNAGVYNDGSASGSPWSRDPDPDAEMLAAGLGLRQWCNHEQ